MGEYTYKTGLETEDIAEGYEVLYSPDGGELAYLTEPEDRTFGRDLWPVVRELNRLHDALNAASRQEAHATRSNE